MDNKCEIIVRACFNKNIRKDKRYCRVPKRELSIKCIKSIAKAAKQTSKISYLTIVLDGEEDPSLKNILAEVSCPTRILRANGIKESASRWFSAGRNSNSDLLYMVEDDYLHCETAIKEIIEDHSLFSRIWPTSQIAIHPFDDPDRYFKDPGPPAQIRLGTNRHYRTNYWSTHTVLITQKTLKDNWDKFTAAGRGLGEDESINLIWRGANTKLLTPIPSLALHMQGEDQRPHFINWEEWWEKV